MILCTEYSVYSTTNWLEIGIDTLVLTTRMYYYSILQPGQAPGSNLQPTKPPTKPEPRRVSVHTIQFYSVKNDPQQAEAQ